MRASEERRPSGPDTDKDTGYMTGEFAHSRFDQIPAALTQTSPTRDHPCRPRRSGGPSRRCVTLPRLPSKVQLQPRGNIASQGLIADAKQPGIWCTIGAPEQLSSVDLFCSVLHLLGTHKEERPVTSDSCTGFSHCFSYAGDSVTSRFTRQVQ
ncbi:TPA: hypothetical protein ACH3X2_007040 [Trebouxia sp. C0005]